MREAFSFRRFGLVLCRELIAGSGKKLLHAILALGCALGVLGVIIGAKNSYSAINSMYLTCFTVFIVFAIGSVNSACADRRRMTSWLILPATGLEKYMSVLAYCFIVLPLSFLPAWMLSELVRNLCRLVFWGSDYMGVTFPLLHVFNVHVAFSFLFMLSFFFLGAFVFRRNAVFKTALAGTLLIMLFTAVCGLSMWLFYGDDYAMFSYKVNILAERLLKHVDLQWFNNCCVLLMTAVNFVLAYFRFKEGKQSYISSDSRPHLRGDSHRRVPRGGESAFGARICGESGGQCQYRYAFL